MRLKTQETAHAVSVMRRRSRRSTHPVLQEALEALPVRLSASRGLRR
nr:MAG TPA: hypothetical protein [Caudoviricetes sp.]